MHAYSSGEKKFIEDVFEKIDDEIDLDFTRVFDKDLAEIRFYKADDAALLLNESDVVGFTEAMNKNNENWMNIWWKNNVPDNVSNYYTEYNVLSEEESFTIVHELGHALGLAHPRELPWAKWHNTSDTIMSYNIKTLSGHKALNFSNQDIASLKLLWGDENDNNTSTKTDKNIGSFSKVLPMETKREILLIENEITKENPNKVNEIDPLTGLKYNGNIINDDVIGKYSVDFNNQNNFKLNLNQVKDEENIQEIFRKDRQKNDFDHQYFISQNLLNNNQFENQESKDEIENIEFDNSSYGYLSNNLNKDLYDIIQPVINNDSTYI